MGQTRSLSKAQPRLQVYLHMSLVCIITIEPASTSSLGGAGAPRVFLNSKDLLHTCYLVVHVWCNDISMQVASTYVVQVCISSLVIHILYDEVFIHSSCVI